MPTWSYVWVCERVSIVHTRTPDRCRSEVQFGALVLVESSYVSMFGVTSYVTSGRSTDDRSSMSVIRAGGIIKNGHEEAVNVKKIVS